MEDFAFEFFRRGHRSNKEPMISYHYSLEKLSKTRTPGMFKKRAIALYLLALAAVVLLCVR